MQMSKGKLPQAVAAVVLAVVMIVMPFLSVFFVGIFLPSQYGETYYAELYDMYLRLRNTNGNKVVVIGNSNVAFGVDSALMESLLREGGLDYSVCNFGLYGSLGTRMMLELSRGYIGEGDIVIFVPEIAEQPLSLYFSAEEAWYALDSGMEMFGDFSGEMRGALAGGFFGYVAKKYALFREGEPASPSGVYAHSSFDDNCDLKNYDRPHNVMDGGTDVNNPVVLEESFYTKEFVDYVNEYYREISARGAAMFYSFPPMNRQSVKEYSQEKVESFYQFVAQCFDFPVMSDIDDCIMESGWFYDSNFHLNAAGMTVRTVNLVNDLKNQFGNTTKTDVALPEMPLVPDPDIEGEGDNSCADCFTYRREGNYYVIDGLTEKGRDARTLVVPYQVDGLYIKSFLPSVFAGNKTVRSIVVQQNIGMLYDGSFDGCSALDQIFLMHSDPSGISVGYGLRDGASFRICVPADALGAFKNDYFWGNYADILYAA